MPEYRKIMVADLIRPKDPMRVETLMENIDSMKLSLASLGQLQPIGVRERTQEGYEIIYGDRRGIAMTLLGWRECAALVYQPGEIAEEMAKGAENLMRNQVSEYEEAKYYEKMWKEQGMGTDHIASMLNVPQGRVESLIEILNGDERVCEAFRLGQVNMSQAKEINLLKTPGYRLQALNMVLTSDYSAKSIRAFRMDVQKHGMEEAAAAALNGLEVMAPPVSEEPMQICCLGDHSVPLRLSRVYIICGDHWQIIIKGLEYHGQVLKIKESGLTDDYFQLLARAEKING